MERHLHNLLYCQTFDSVVKDLSCSGGFCKNLQSWKKESKCFGQCSHCHRHTQMRCLRHSHRLACH
ncbi:hypothetical protein NP493_454g04000 [Ridgeia piscesae]|uniref:Uncharacterized protein n=1 Tax=Ridgeia piscesae TaxID=27915 RepID=A0AAD9KZC0_RIDPI|nr:hypothetical protein NP493_454g04000 [Ridgeia piscesae]